jgi:hypothetical protein
MAKTFAEGTYENEVVQRKAINTLSHHSNLLASCLSSHISPARLRLQILQVQPSSLREP